MWLRQLMTTPQIFQFIIRLCILFQSPRSITAFQKYRSYPHPFACQNIPRPVSHHKRIEKINGKILARPFEIPELLYTERPFVYPIKTSFPSNANPYFRILPSGIPFAISVCAYFFSSICARAACTVSARLLSLLVLNTLNSIIIASNPSFFGSSIMSYLPNPLSLLEVIV